VKSVEGIGLEDVNAVYDGAEGDLWELMMGEQIHIGGFVSSMDLAEQAGIGSGQRGVDLCCCNGAGMRFLVRFRGVASMIGVDATRTVIERGRSRCKEEGLSDRIQFKLADVCETGLPDGEVDFVWGEDTGRFGPYVDLYLQMSDMQLTYDAMKILGFDLEMVGEVASTFKFFQELAHAGKIAQGRFIARKK
jgi:hypothetical protein